MGCSPGFKSCHPKLFGDMVRKKTKFTVLWVLLAVCLQAAPSQIFSGENLKAGNNWDFTSLQRPGWRDAILSAWHEVEPLPHIGMPSRTAVDLRSFMHGIESAKSPDGGLYIFFSSNGLPPSAGGDSWGHDVYLSRWRPGDLKISQPEVFIRNPEAQEPVSVARTNDGHIMLTFEDGYNTPNEVAQRYGVYDPGLRPIKAYPNDVKDGGHSGHVAAVGNQFVVFYSSDWVYGGGVDDLGSGNGVYASIYDSSGKLLREAAVAPETRQWWPMITASPKNAFLLWQEFVKGKEYATLHMALLNPGTGALSAKRVLGDKIEYYTYKAEYVPDLRRFIVTGTSADGKGFALLIDDDGRTTAAIPCMPATMRESGITVQGNMAYTPSQDGRLLQLELAQDSIKLKAVQQQSMALTYMGSLGFMRDARTVHWISLTTGGLVETDLDLRQAGMPALSDVCHLVE